MKRATWTVAALAAATLTAGSALASGREAITFGPRSSQHEAAIAEVAHHDHGHGYYGYHGGYHGGCGGPVIAYPPVYVYPPVVIPYPRYPHSVYPPAYPYPSYRTYRYYPGNELYYRGPSFGFSFQF